MPPHSLLLFLCPYTPLSSFAFSLPFCTFKFFSAFVLSLEVALRDFAYPSADIWG